MTDVVNVGAYPNDGTGDVDRRAFIAINQALSVLLAHLRDIANPHNVTARQVGAYSKIEADQNLAAALQGLPTLQNVAAAVSTAIVNLNLGSAATRTAGTAANNLAPLDGTAKLPTSIFPDAVLAASQPFVGDGGAGGSKGLVPAPAAGDAAAGKFLAADGTFKPLPSSGGTGVVPDKSIANGKLSDVATATFKGRATAGSGSPEDLSVAQATALLVNFLADTGTMPGSKGLVPAPSAGDAAAGKLLTASGSWVAPPAGTTKATGSDLRTGTNDDKFITSKSVYDASAFVPLVDTANIAIDLSSGINFRVTLSGNRTLAAPSNLKDGQSGIIRVKQDATGGRTLTFDAAYKFPGGNKPVFSTAANAVDRFAYLIANDGTSLLIECTALEKAIA